MDFARNSPRVTVRFVDPALRRPRLPGFPVWFSVGWPILSDDQTKAGCIHEARNSCSSSCFVQEQSLSTFRQYDDVTWKTCSCAARRHGDEACPVDCPDPQDYKDLNYGLVLPPKGKAASLHSPTGVISRCRKKPHKEKPGSG